MKKIHLVVIITDVAPESRRKSARVTVIDPERQRNGRCGRMVIQQQALRGGISDGDHALHHAEEDQHIQAAGYATQAEAAAKATVDHEQFDFAKTFRQPAVKESNGVRHPEG